MKSEVTAKTLVAPQGMSGLACEPWTPGEIYAVAADWGQASCPVLTWGDGDWTNEPHGRQVADFRHEPSLALRDLLCEEIRAGGCDVIDSEVDEILTDAEAIGDFEKAEYRDTLVRLRPDADTTTEEASEWYDAYGWHYSTDDAGDIMLQAVEYDWLEYTDEAVDKLMANNGRITRDEASAIVEMAASVREMAEEVEGLLDDAVEAYKSGDIDATIQALEAASCREGDAGDDPATRELASRLLEELD